MKKIASVLVALLLLFVLTSRIIGDWETVSSLELQLTPSNVFLILVSLISIYAVNIYSWHFSTKLVGGEVSLRDNIRVWLLSNLTRLLPGGVWQYPSRVVLLSKHKVSKAEGTYAVLLEVLFTVTMGAVAVFITLPYWKLPEQYAPYSSLLLLFAIIPLGLIFFMVSEKNIQFLISILSKLTNRANKFRPITIHKQYLLPAFILFFLRFVTIGIAFYFAVNLFIPIGPEYVISTIGIFALSWMLGFVVIIAPGGIGVTEGVLATLMSTYMPFSVAASLAIIFRIFLIGTEGVLVSSLIFTEALSKAKKK